MSDKKLYPADLVLKMLFAAYKAGFEGPLEMLEETCNEIIQTMTPHNNLSDLSIMEYMHNKNKNKNTM